MPDTSRYVIRPEDVETLAFDWGQLAFTCSPSVNEATRLSAGIVTMGPGEGHGRHNHAGAEEIIHVISGSGEQMIEDESGQPITWQVGPETTIFVPSGRFHATRNTGDRPMTVFVVYAPHGPETLMRSLPGCRILPPGGPAGKR